MKTCGKRAYAVGIKPALTVTERSETTPSVEGLGHTIAEAIIASDALAGATGRMEGHLGCVIGFVLIFECAFKTMIQSFLSPSFIF